MTFTVDWVLIFLNLSIYFFYLSIPSLRQCAYGRMTSGRYLHVEDAGDADGAADAIQTQRGNVLVIAVLQAHTERSKKGRPRHLNKHKHYESIPAI